MFTASISFWSWSPALISCLILSTELRSKLSSSDWMCALTVAWKDSADCFGKILLVEHLDFAIREGERPTHLLNRASSISWAVIFFPSKRTSFAFAMPTIKSGSIDSLGDRDRRGLTATNEVYTRPSFCDNPWTKCQSTEIRTRSRLTQEWKRDRKVDIWKGIDEIKVTEVRCFLDQKKLDT